MMRLLLVDDVFGVVLDGCHLTSIRGVGDLVRLVGHLDDARRPAVAR